MTSMLTQNLASHKELLRTRTEQIDKLNEQIRELSTMQKQDLESLQEVKERVRLREERKQKVANLRREIERKKAATKKPQGRRSNAKSANVDLKPSWLDDITSELLDLNTSDGQTSAQQRQTAIEKLPSASVIQARLNAYQASNGRLQHDADQLRSRSIELEALYRKVVSLCTGVAEDKVEESLPGLVAAIESEKGGIGEQEVGRVREFLRRVDGSRGEPSSQSSGPMLQVNPTIVAAAERAAAERAQDYSKLMGAT